MCARLVLDPCLVNTSSAFSGSAEEIQQLYDSPHTGAVTTRTAQLDEGFHESSEHQHMFFRAPLSAPLQPSSLPHELSSARISALNTYGYSPHPLPFYLSLIASMVPDPAAQHKPFIISVAGAPSVVATSIQRISEFAADKQLQVHAEVNLSCPNIAGTAPAGYSPAEVHMYLAQLDALRRTLGGRLVKVGLKTPPYTYAEQMRELVRAVESFPAVVSFITATNTLGNCIYFPSTDNAPFHYGALSGPMIHPLALGNVHQLRQLLDASAVDGVRGIVIIGAGGVGDHAAFQRMRAVGAGVVGVGTALGWAGVAGLGAILGA